ncbi:TPA: hypothetical protein MI547_06550 [Klebsiella pneumoniae]|nr:hypothetical protein [Klebsiella pneumoniae]
MTGSDARQADVLFKAIVDYYGNMSGSDITTSQVNQRDKIIASGVIECDASLDRQILSLQDELIEADNALTTEEMYARRKFVIETAINLIS